MSTSPDSLPPDSALPSLPAFVLQLATGAGLPLFTVNSWAAQLGSNPESDRFIEQLRREWYPLTIPDAFCQSMLDFVRETISTYIGWQHLWAHTLRVTGTMLALAPEANIPPEDAFLMGIFHDIGKPEEMRSGESHEEIGAQIFRKTLQGQLPDSLINLMANVIAKKSSPLNPYTHLLYDADKLDKIGAAGIARRISSDWGSQHIRFALGRVWDDMFDFPAMHFATSRQQANQKLKFTKQFMEFTGTR